MKALVQQKQKAIELRQKGYSYSEILKEVPVAKSSLSLWLKDLPLTEREKAALKFRTTSNISRGRIKAAAQLRQNRISRDRKTANIALETFERFKNEQLFQCGVSLYWAEGAKRSDMFQFVNSNPDMIKIMLKWIEHYTEIDRNTLTYRLYIHQAYAHENLEEWWSNELLVSKKFKRSVIKPSDRTVRKRTNYKGCLRVEIPQSGALLKMMKRWIDLLVEYHTKR